MLQKQGARGLHAESKGAKGPKLRKTKPPKGP
jgi:hypothetical protein